MCNYAATDRLEWGCVGRMEILTAGAVRLLSKNKKNRTTDDDVYVKGALDITTLLMDVASTGVVSKPMRDEWLLRRTSVVPHRVAYWAKLAYGNKDLPDSELLSRLKTNYALLQKFQQHEPVTAHERKTLKTFYEGLRLRTAIGDIL